MLQQSSATWRNTDRYPTLQPILKQVTAVLMEGSKAVIDSDDQYQVFDDPNASDPSHSLLSKVCTFAPLQPVQAFILP